MTHFNCPHCGIRTSTERTDVEWVDIGGADSLFPSLPPGMERHIDQRLCCQKCYDRARARLPSDSPHPYDVATHQARLTALDAAFAATKES